MFVIYDNAYIVIQFLFVHMFAHVMITTHTYTYTHGTGRKEWFMHISRAQNDVITWQFPHYTEHISKNKQSHL